MSAPYAQLFPALLPEAALSVGALAVIAVDLITGKKRSAPARLNTAVTLAIGAIAVALYCTGTTARTGPVFGGILVLDALTCATRLGVLALTAFTLAITPGLHRLRHPAEYVAIILFAATGFTLMAAAHHLLIAFLALELASLSLYVLTGFDKNKPESAEAALKYFLFGGISAAFLLFGLSLLYGVTGALEFAAITRQLSAMPPHPLLIVALAMILVGFGFKAAAAPFHLWAPDVYEGAPITSAALIASASKLAGFALFTRLLWDGLAPSVGTLATAGSPAGWALLLALLSALSLLLGNLAALAQTNVRRLLAYSAIAHAGAMLLGVIAAGQAGPAPLVYYAFTYGLATIGAFGVIAVVDGAGSCKNLPDLAGLHRRSPLLAGCLLIFILSLAGIPPLAGFFGKFVVFAAALKLGGLATSAGWLTLLAIAMSAVGLYYYLLILKQALIAPPTPATHATIPVPALPAISLLILAILLLALGLFPSLVLRLVN